MGGSPAEAHNITGQAAWLSSSQKEDWKTGAKVIGAGLAVSALLPALAPIGGLIAIGGAIGILHKDEDDDVTRAKAGRGRSGY